MQNIDLIKDLYPEYVTNSSKIKQPSQQNWVEDLNKYFTKKTDEWQISKKRCSNHHSLVKCKLKTQGDSTSHPRGWLRLKRLIIASVREDTGQLEFSYIAWGSEMVQSLWETVWQFPVFLFLNIFIGV